MKDLSPHLAMLAGLSGVAGSSPVLMIASPSGKSSDHGSIPIGTWALGLLMKELLTLFGEPTILTLIPITLRFAWITSAMLMNPGVSFWVRSARVTGVFTPDAAISFFASARFGVFG